MFKLKSKLNKLSQRLRSNRLTKHLGSAKLVRWFASLFRRFTFKTISKRLSFVFVVVLIMSALVGSAGVIGAKSISSTIKDTADVALPHAEISSSIAAKTVKLQTAFVKYLASHGHDAYERASVLGVQDEVSTAVKTLGDENIDFAFELVEESTLAALESHDLNATYHFVIDDVEYSIVSFLNTVAVGTWEYLKTIEGMAFAGDFEGALTDPTQSRFGKWYASFESPTEELAQLLAVYSQQEAAAIKFVADTLAADPDYAIANLAEFKSVYLNGLDTAMAELMSVSQEQLAGVEEEMSVSYGDTHSFINNLITSVRAEQSIAMTQMEESVHAAEKRSTDVLIAIGAILIGGLSVSIFAAVYTMRKIGRPLGELSTTIEALADRNFDVDVPHKDRIDEIGAIAHAAETFLENGLAHEKLERDQEVAREVAEKERVERERAEHDAEMAAIEAKRLAKEAEDERHAEIEAAAEAERQERHAEQSLVVESLANGLKQLATGDLSTQINVSFVASYEQLRLDFNEAVRTLSTAVESITGSALIITDNVGELSSAANDLSIRTERSAASLEETSSALEEMTASVRSASQGAQEADALVKATHQGSEAGREIVTQAVDAMSEIDQSSQKISKITSVIDDIAFQTNLLALNAGVEAARAGEAGRGFAVVASEVRSLAQRSSEAAREISELIAQSNGQVKHGVQLVDKVGTSLSMIVDSVTEVSSHVSGIATTSSEQAAGIGEINNSVTEMDQTTQQNAAMFEETTAATQSLAQEAQRLSAAIAAFKIGSKADFEAALEAASDLPTDGEDWTDMDTSDAEFEQGETLAAI